MIKIFFNVQNLTQFHMKFSNLPRIQRVSRQLLVIRDYL